MEFFQKAPDLSGGIFFQMFLRIVKRAKTKTHVHTKTCGTYVKIDYTNVMISTGLKPRIFPGQKTFLGIRAFR